MSGLKEIFFCCGAIPNDPQIVINMQQKRRSFSCKTPDKRTFIKRSVGKNPILDLSIKNTNKSTENTPKSKSNIKLKRMRDPNDSTLQQNSFDFSIQTVEKNNSMYHLSSQNGKERGQYEAHRQKMEKFINFNDYNTKQFQCLIPPNSNQNMFQLYEPTQLKIPNNHDRRILSHRQSQSAKTNLDFQNRHLMKTMKTILQAMDERSSIPSMEESQMHEMRQISSKTTIKSNMYDRNQGKSSQSPLTEKYESMIFKPNRSKQQLRMTSSQNLQSFCDKSNEQLIWMALSKLQMENRIVQKELKALRQQQNFLQQQKSFDRCRFEAQIANIGKIREEYVKRLGSCQFQLNQIKQIMRDKQQKSSN